MYLDASKNAALLVSNEGNLLCVGKILASLPVDVRVLYSSLPTCRVGKLLCLGYVFGCLKECCIIGK